MATGRLIVSDKEVVSRLPNQNVLLLLRQIAYSFTHHFKLLFFPSYERKFINAALFIEYKIFG